MALVPTRQLYRFTVDEYLAFERASDERHEYLDGLIYAMAGESPNHRRLCTNLGGLLYAHLRGSPCEAFSKDTKVRCGPYAGAGGPCAARRRPRADACRPRGRSACSSRRPRTGWRFGAP